MEGKVALITGASKGLGREVAEVFAKSGMNVIINYNNSFKEALDLAHYLEKEYLIKAIAIKADVSVENEVLEMIDEVKRIFNKIDVLVNNAGIANDSLFLEKTKEDFIKVLETNLIGPFLVCKYASKVMDKGSIINISSTNAFFTNYPYSADYDASKAGLISLTNNLAIELSPNIRVNAIASGWIKTDMSKDLEPNYLRKEEEKILLGRFADPIEIAEVVYFLASDKSSYVNKSVLVVDGGYNG